MARRLREVDAVMVGMGWTGAILARELTKAGLKVVGLERGMDQTPAENFTIPSIRDELRFSTRFELMQDTAIETISFRNAPAETALPMRRLGAFLIGNNVGGAGVHWGGQHWRYLPTDFRVRSHLSQRYGKGVIPADMTIADWPVSYDELEPHYDYFDKICGISGKAGNLRGRIIAGGNVFEGPRSNEYPNKPLQKSLAGEMFETASRDLGYHPFPLPAANSSAAYTNPEGMTLGRCEYCGFCDRFGCESNAKASANVSILPLLRADARFELRARSYVTGLVYDKRAKRVTSVLYTDLATGEELEQPAGIVVLSAYVFGNTLLMLLAGIGEPYDHASGTGVVGKNYCYQFEAGVQTFFADKEFNPFIGGSGMAVVIDDFNGDNFDHGGLGFLGGGYISCNSGGARPIAGRPVPHGTPRWGAAWKRATAQWYRRALRFNTEGSVYANRDNFLDLDPTYRDAFGRPLIRMTYNGTENDHRMSRYLLDAVTKIIRTMNPTIVEPQPRPRNFTIVPYQSTHNTGGTMMGTDPRNSVVNRYLQAWDAHNVFVMGASVFPQQHGYNPTGTVGALAYWSAAAITGQYLKQPGPLVHA